MKGFLKKDLLIIKGNLKMVLIFMVVFSLATFKGSDTFLFIPSFLSAILIISTFSYDEYNKWDAYAATLPQGRKNAVKAKYMSALALILFGILISCLFLVISFLVHSVNLADFKEMLFTLVGVAFGSTIIPTLTFPLIYKFGVEKGRIGVFLIVFLGIALISFVATKIKLVISPNIMEMLSKYGIVIFFIVTVILFLISYKISERLYLKKEF